MPFTLDDKTLNTLRIIECTQDDSERQSAIYSLSGQGSNSDRVLMELFHSCMWRETKIDLIRALGKSKNSRGLEFLMRLATDETDLGIARESVLALGQTETLMAAEFLLSMLQVEDHPLCREAAMALTNIQLFPSATVFARILKDRLEKLSPRMVQYLLLGLGRQGDRRHLPIIKGILESDVEKDSFEFQAAMVASGLIGTPSFISFLEKIDTRTSFFTHQLKLNAIDRIRSMGHFDFEDALIELAAAYDEDEMLDQALQLRGLDPGAVWNTYLSLKNETNTSSDLLIRICLVNPNRWQQDKNHIVQYFNDLDSEHIALLIRSHSFLGVEGCLEEICKLLPVSSRVELARKTNVGKLPQTLVDVANDRNMAVGMRINAVNGLVQQAWMNAFDSDLKKNVESTLLGLLDDADQHPLFLRSIRALGQIGSAHPDFMVKMKEVINNDVYEKSSLYNALQLADTMSAVEIISKRLLEMGSDQNCLSEQEAAIRSLAQMRVPLNFRGLADLNQEARQLNKPGILKILSLVRVDGYNDLILKALDSADFQIKMLAIAAAKFNNSQKILRKLMSFLIEDNPSFFSRALDTICVGATAAIHLKVIQWLGDNDRGKKDVLKVLRSLVPEEEQAYVEFVALLESYMREKKGCFADEEVVEAAINLRESIAFIQFSSDDDTNKVDVGHSHDDKIKELVDFDQLSESVKAALRSGEITFSYTDLFNEKVDRSAIVVQLVKSIDLFLRDHLGNHLFVISKKNSITDLQSRVIKLQLDDTNIATHRWIEDLSVEGYFTEDSFPRHKMQRICQSILDGRFSRNQYRLIDGLRAWSIILLLFARPFTYRGIEMEPLIKLAPVTTFEMNQLVSQMNKLQHLRNKAAHLDTLVENSMLSSARDISYEVLNGLIKLVKKDKGGLKAS